MTDGETDTEHDPATDGEETDESDWTDHLGMLAYVVFLPATVFLGPLEAVLGLGLFQLLSSTAGDSSDESADAT